jgi:hypothetical protein
MSKFSSHLLSSKMTADNNLHSWKYIHTYHKLFSLGDVVSYKWCGTPRITASDCGSLTVFPYNNEDVVS